MEPTLKVLHLGKFFPPEVGGIESFLKELCIGLSDHSVKNIVLAHTHDPKSKQNYEQHLSTKNGKTIKIFRAKSYGDFFFVPISPSFPLLLHRLLKTECPDVIHIHMPNLSAFWLLLINTKKDTSWVIHWHSDVLASKHNWKLRLFYPIYKLFEQALLKRTDSIIVTSQAYLNNSAALKGWHRKCDVIQLGINPENIPLSCESLPSALPFWPDDKLRVLTIGRLTYYKGFEILINAVCNLPNISVIIIGEGLMREKLKRLITNNGISHRVFLAGYVSDSEKSYYLDNCNCFCLPSYEKTEAFGMVLLEAMSFSKALIACSIKGSGVPWIIRDKVTGYLAEPESTKSMQNTLKAVSVNAAVLKEMGAKGNKDLHERFLIDLVASKIVTLYKKTLVSR